MKATYQSSVSFLFLCVPIYWLRFRTKEAVGISFVRHLFDRFILRQMDET